MKHHFSSFSYQISIHPNHHPKQYPCSIQIQHPCIPPKYTAQLINTHTTKHSNPFLIGVHSNINLAHIIITKRYTMANTIFIAKLTALKILNYYKNQNNPHLVHSALISIFLKTSIFPNFFVNKNSSETDTAGNRECPDHKNSILTRIWVFLWRFRGFSENSAEMMHPNQSILLQLLNLRILLISFSSFFFFLQFYKAEEEDLMVKRRKNVGNKENLRNP